ncbi:MAG: SHOCT domain-containing protein [candidate division Zixibacteria bacterium]|nr:SHOCT domain-containing protein [candidate division Zixibacteria bacterium]
MHMWGFGWLGMIIFWIVVIFFIALVVKWLLQQGRSEPRSPAQEENALEILKKRYARGEINKEEFEQKKKDLTGI